MTDTAKSWMWIAILLVVGVLSRWVPHPPNFSATIAIALFAGFVLPARAALLIPILATFIGDLAIGTHDLMWVVYLSLIPIIWVGSRLPEANRKPMTWVAWGTAGLLASVFFFITTNLAVWWDSGMYPHTQAGLEKCFLLAIPFFDNTLLSTVVYVAGFEGLRRLNPLARTQEVI